MNSYARLAFFLGEYDILEKQEEKVLFRNGEAICTMKIKHTKKPGIENDSQEDMNVDVMVVFNYGPFADEKVALEEGRKLFFSVKKSFSKNYIAMKIFNEFGILDSEKDYYDNGGLTVEGLASSAFIHPELDGHHVANGFLGLKVYQSEIDISKVKFYHQAIETWKKFEFPDIELNNNKIDSKLLIAYSLLNSSLAINDLRTNFILKISAVEALVPEDSYKDENYCNAINQIVKSIDAKIINSNENDPIEIEKNVQRLKSSIGSLKKKSIAEKCNDLIIKCDLTKQYDSKSPVAFFKECYQLRSNFVHTGKMNKKESELNDEINELVTKTISLHELVIDILEKYEYM